MNNDKSRVEVWLKAKTSRKFPIVLIKRLEDINRKTATFKTTSANTVEHIDLKYCGGTIHEMKSGTSNTPDGYAQTEKIPNYMNHYKRNKELVDRKSVIIDRAKEKSVNADIEKNILSDYQLITLPVDINKKQNMTCTEVSQLSEDQCDSNASKKWHNKCDVDEQPQNLCKKSMLRNSADRKNFESDIAARKFELNFPQHRDGIQVMRNITNAAEIQNKSSFSNIPNTEHFTNISKEQSSCVTQPTSSVGQFDFDLNERSHQNKSSAFVDDIVPLIVNSIEEMRKDYSKFHKLKTKNQEDTSCKIRTSSNKKFENRDCDRKHSDYLKIYLPTSNKANISKMSIACRQANSVSNSNNKRSLEEDPNTQYFEKRNRYYSNLSIHGVVNSSNTLTENCNKNISFNLTTTNETHAKINNLAEIDKLTYKNLPIIGKRSLSLGDLKIVSENVNRKIKPSISLSDLTPSKVLELSKLSIRNASAKKLDDTNSSSTTTTDDINISEDSSTDEDLKPLQVDVGNFEAASSENFQTENSKLSFDIKHCRRHKKLKILSKTKHNGKKYNKQVGIPNEKYRKTYKRRSDKKKEEINGTSNNDIRLQQVVNEQERGKRLAQELPGFNWLEEKILKKRDASQSKDNQDENYAHSRKTPVVLNLDQYSSKDFPTSSNPVPALITESDIEKFASSKPVHPSSLGYQATLNVFTESKTEMTLNTVSSSTPRHSPNAEDVEKPADEYAEPPFHETKQLDEPSNQPISYLKRHIQTAVPPLIPTYKVIALPKQKMESKELKSNRKTQSDSIYESGKIGETSPIPNFKSAKDVESKFPKNFQDKPSDIEHINTEKKTSTCHTEKLSILKEAFKSKLNGCPELKSMDCDVQCVEPKDDGVSFRRQSFSETSSKMTTEDTPTINRNNSKMEECSTNSPKEDDELYVPESDNSSLADSLLGKILMQDSKPTINSPLVIATLLEELMKTRKEVEKLRKVQEQMLKGEKFNDAVMESKTKNEKYSNSPINLSPVNNAPAQDISEVKKNNERSLQGEIDNRNDRKRENSMEQNYVNKKQKTLSQSPEDPNTITIRYTLPQYLSKCNTDSVQLKDTDSLRNKMETCNTDLDVIAVNKQSPFQKHEANLSTRKLIQPSSTAPLKCLQEKNFSKDKPYKNELMRLLDPSCKYERTALPEMPNLIPSSNCSTSAFHKNIYYGDKLPPNLTRYPYSHPRSTLPSKPGSQILDPHIYHPRLLCESRNDAVFEREMQESPNHKMTLSKPLEKQYGVTNAKISQQREALNSRNEQFSNLNYPSHYTEKISYETANILKQKIAVPPPQTFHPKILIPPEGSNARYKEWHSAYVASTSDPHSYQRSSSQAPIHVNSLTSPNVSSAYQYKPGMNTKVTEVYAPPNRYSPNSLPRDSSTIKQYREQSRSPAGIKSPRVSNCVNPFINQAGIAHSSPAYYSSQMRAMQSSAPAIVNSSHSQFPQVIAASRNLATSKQVYYEQRPVVQAPPVQKMATTFTHRAHSPPFLRGDNHHSQRYIMPSSVYDNRPLVLEEHDTKPSHQSNSLSPDISQPRVVTVNQPKTFHESVNSSPIRNCSPNTKILSKKCHLCDRLAQFVCSGCKLAWYCSKECQREHWSEHSPTCSKR